MGITGNERRKELPHALGILFQLPGPGTDNFYPSVPIPGPYPENPPVTEQLPDHWYVIMRGIEVGIFADK